MAKKAVKAKTGTSVAVYKDNAPAAPVTFLEFLDKASRDPEFDAAKFQVLLAAKERQDARAAEAEFDRCMADAQRDMAPIRADMSNSQTKSNYASDVALDRAIRPIYSKYGFALSFGTGDNPPADHVRVTCRISCAGHHRTEHFDIPVITTGPKGNDVMTKVHATGSAGSYGRRYLLMMIFNLTVIKKPGRNEPFADDDGNAAAGMDFVSEKQIEKIRSLIVEVAADIPRFCRYMKVQRIEEIPSAQFDDAIKALEAKKKTA